MSDQEARAGRTKGIRTEIRCTPANLDHILAACQQLSDDDTRILQTALAWDVEDVETAERLAMANAAEDPNGEALSKAMKTLDSMDVPQLSDDESCILDISQRVAILAGRLVTMKRREVEAHNELDRVSIERSDEGAVHQLPFRVAILAGRYVDNQRRLAQIGAQSVQAEAGAELPKPLFAEGDRIVAAPTSTLPIPADVVGTVTGRQWCGGCGGWHYRVDFGEVRPGYEGVAGMKEGSMRLADNGKKPTNDEKEDDLFGEIDVRIGPDGYPWVSILGLIGLLENLGAAACRNSGLAEEDRAEEEIDLEDEIDPDVPLWKVELGRGIDHFINAVRVWSGR